MNKPQVRKNTITIAWVTTNDRFSGQKKRPIYIINTNGINMTYFSITTKFKDKSEYLKRFYLEIIDWAFANLDKPRYINTYDIYNVSVVDISTEFIGNLSERDTDRLLELLKKRNSLLNN